MGTENGNRWSDQRVEQMIGGLLAFGLALAASVVLIGAAIYLMRHGGEKPDYRVFRGEPADLRTIPGILGDARQLSGRGIIQLGLLLLLATPVARVVLSIFAFAVQRDALYVVVTLVVLTLLLYSIVGGYL
ncbi:MAG TPA: DUF1634 domain-containing protein [Candidatus Bathyarchaeia archaeon]|nr:DUF1634 domain-containing protein [Candidatus Bathyarchaeia archaeon]